MIRRLILLSGLIVAVFLSATSILPVEAASQSTFSKARLECILLSRDAVSRQYAAYGQIKVYARGVWKPYGQNRFFRVFPARSWTDHQMAAFLGRGALLEGMLIVSPGQRDDLFRVERVRVLSGPAPRPPVEDWVGFGKTLNTSEVAKFNLSKVTDFVNVLAELRDAVLGRNADQTGNEFILAPDQVKHLAQKIKSPEGGTPAEKRESLARFQRVRLWWNGHWNVKWLVEKDAVARNDLRRSVGGSAFYLGKLCFYNGFVETVPVVRSDIDRFMASATGGGSANIVSGPAVFFAGVTATRDENGRIVKLYASGPLFETPRALVEGIAHSTKESETWRLEGWTSERAKILDGKKCWLSGTRVLVYDDKGNLIDQYFQLDKTLTRAEFDSVLDLIRELIFERGV